MDRGLGIAKVDKISYSQLHHCTEPIPGRLKLGSYRFTGPTVTAICWFQIQQFKVFRSQQVKDDRQHNQGGRYNLVIEHYQTSYYSTDNQSTVEHV